MVYSPVYAARGEASRTHADMVLEATRRKKDLLDALAQGATIDEAFVQKLKDRAGELDLGGKDKLREFFVSTGTSALLVATGAVAINPVATILGAVVGAVVEKGMAEADLHLMYNEAKNLIPK